MTFRAQQLVGFGVLAILLYLFVYGGYGFGLGSVLASTNLPLKLEIGQSSRSVWMVSVAGVGLAASEPSVCPGFEQPESEFGGAVNSACWYSDVTWNGMPTRVFSNDPGPYTIGGFLVVRPGSIGRFGGAVSGQTSPDIQSGWKVELFLDDVKNFYETRFVRHPDLVKLHQGGVPAVVDFKSLLGVPSLGGLTVKDDTKILRTEVAHRFFDEFPVKPGSVYSAVGLSDKTLGDVTTSVQPHFYVVQTVISYGPNPGRSSTGGGRGVSDEDIGKEAVFAFYPLLAAKYEELLKKAVSKPFFESKTSDLSELGIQLLQRRRNLEGLGLEKELVAKGNAAYVSLVDRFGVKLGVADGVDWVSYDPPNGLSLTVEEQKQLAALIGEVRGLRAVDGDSVIPTEFAVPRLERISKEEDRNSGEFDQLLKDYDGLGGDPTKFSGVSFQSVFNLFSASQPSLPTTGSVAGNFLVSGANNYVYKFLFLEGGEARYQVGANLDYSKYKIVDDQYTPFNKRIILKSGTETTPSQSAELPMVPEGGASWSKTLVNAPLQAFGHQGFTSDIGGKTIFFVVLLVLAGIAVFGGKS